MSEQDKKDLLEKEGKEEKSKEDGLVPRKLLSEAQMESRKRKEKIKSLKSELAQAQSELSKVKGSDDRFNSLLERFKSAEVDKVISSLGDLDDDALSVIKPLIAPHVNFSPDTYEVTIGQEEIDKIRKVLGSKPEKTPKNTNEDILMKLKEKRQGKVVEDKPVSTRDKFKADLQALKDKK